MQSNNENNLIVQFTFDFALKIIKYTELLENAKRYVLATQLLKSGTAIGSCVRESQNAESKSDFIHKLKIAAKEADETEYWLLLCQKTEGYPPCNELVTNCSSIIKILSKIISTTKKSMQSQSS